MRKAVWHMGFICSLFFLWSCNQKAYLFTSFHEPADKGLRMLYSFDGKKWNDLDTVLLQPKVGEQKVMRDPAMIRDKNGVFHLVWTSSWRGDKGFGYASSKNLVNWSDQWFIPVMKHEPTTVNVWAPELFYDDTRDQYMIIWASCIPGRFEKGMEADSNNHRMYMATTRDFVTFSDTRLFLDPGFSVIDAVIVKKGEKDYVLVLKDNTRPERNCKVAFSKDPMGPWENLSTPFSASFTEGPTVLKRGEEWLIYYDSYQKKIYEAVQTRDFKSFEDFSGRIQVPSGHKHGTIVPVSKKLVKELIRKMK